MSARRRALFLALFTTFLWSTSWVLIKVGLDQVEPLTFAGLRYALAAVVLAAVWSRRPDQRRALASTDTSTRWRLVGLGLVMYALTQGAQFVGLSLLPAATLSLALSFTPVLVALVGIRLLGERPTSRQVLGMVVAATGAAIHLAGDLRPVSVAGVVVAVVALGANGTASLLGRAVNRSAALPALTVTTASMSAGAAVLLPVGVLIEGWPSLDATGWLIIAWLAVVNTALAFTLWNASLQHLEATESSAVNNTMLVQIAVLAWVFLGESLTAAQVTGLLLASVGIVLVQRRRTPPAPPRRQLRAGRGGC